MLEVLRELSQRFLQIKQVAYHRYFYRFMSSLPRMAILLGQRGVGKTTLLVQYLLAYADGDRFSPKILYVQADHFLIGNLSLYEIAEQFHLTGGKVIAIDEIHKYPQWSRELKSIFDTFPDLQILASGSSALSIYHGSHDLSRRAVTYSIVGLSFREYLELTLDTQFEVLDLETILTDHLSIADQINQKISKLDQKILPIFADYLRRGYYPYSFEFKDEVVFYITLEQNLHATIEVDLAAIYPQLTGNSIKKIKKLLVFIAQSVPFTPNWNKLQSLLEIGDQRTLKNYFKYLEQAGLIKTIEKNSDQLRQIEQPEKVYLDNPNQMFAIAAANANTGAIRETFFLDMLEPGHTIRLPHQGDFLVNNQYLFEIGGRNKKNSQIKSSPNAFIAADDIEIGGSGKIPLWLFGFIY